MKVNKYMTHPVIKVDANTDALNAAKIMAEQNVDSLLITSDNRDIGIITFLMTSSQLNKNASRKPMLKII